MKLSIIVPVYNAGMYISNCLDSLLDQGLSKDEYEIIVVNDGSTDNSLSVISRYKKRFSCIKVVSQENAGQSVARNTGIESGFTFSFRRFCLLITVGAKLYVAIRPVI